MKKVLIVGIALLLYLAGFAQRTDSTITQQKLIGVWQINSATLGSALQENFQFFPDGKFDFNFSEYDDAQRILALQGHYHLKDGYLYMTVESRVEITGGYYTKGSPGFQRAEFVLEGGKVETVRQIDSSGGKDPFIISVCKISKTGKIMGIQIDNNKYFKLSDNPSAFRKPATRQK
jgi:hypothetical protein